MHIRSRFPGLPLIPEANVYDLIFGAPEAAQTPDYAVYIDGPTGRKHSFHDYREFVRDAATALGAPQAQGGLALSGDAGDIVGIFSHNCVSFPVLVHALLAITTPIALLSAYATPYELARALRTTKPKYIFAQPALLPTALAAAKEVGLPQDRIYILEGTNGDGRTNLQNLVDRVKQHGAPREPIRPAKKDTLAYLVFSSGTSGLPKAVMISHRNLWALMMSNIVSKQEEAKFTKAAPPKDPPVNLAFMPLYHAYSLHVVVFRPFRVPTTVVIMPKWNASAVLQAIPRYCVTNLFLVPSAVHQLVSHPDFDRTDFSSVVSVVCTAARLPSALRDRFLVRFKGIALVEVFGMSEATVSIARKPVDGLFGLKVPESCSGLILPSSEIRTVRDDGSEADVDEPGELWVKAPTVGLGYYGNEQATKETFVDGWLRTGDHMKVDKDGLLYFVERKKDTLKVSGAQVSPSEIEDVLHIHPDKLITDVCVGGVSGGRTSDEKVPRAWVVLSDEGRRRGAEEAMTALDSWTKQNLSSYKWLRGGLEVVDAIPKNATGSIMRRLLQEKFEAQYTTRAKL